MTAPSKNIAVILAGGRGTRMGGLDKGEVQLGGTRLIDHVIARLQAQVDPEGHLKQVDQILISGRIDYGTGFPDFADLVDGPAGPAGGLWAALHWLRASVPEVTRFFTVPVDAPFFPGDLCARLGAAAREGGTGSAIAATENNVHPTFGCWSVSALQEVLSVTSTERYGRYSEKGPSLFRLSKQIEATHVLFENEDQFANINSPEDLKHEYT